MNDTMRRLRHATTTVERPVFEGGTLRAHRIERDYVVPTQRDLMRASAAWMMMVFAACYVALPLAAHVTGLFTGLLAGFPAAFVAFGGVMAVTGITVSKLRPQVLIPKKGAELPSEPWIAATLGGFGAWAILHNVVPGLVRLWELTGVEALTFTGMNLIESALFGLMLGSLVRSRKQAVAAGVAFQVLFMGLWCAVRMGVGI